MGGEADLIAALVAAGQFRPAAPGAADLGPYQCHRRGCNFGGLEIRARDVVAHQNMHKYVDKKAQQAMEERRAQIEKVKKARGPSKKTTKSLVQMAKAASKAFNKSGNSKAKKGDKIGPGKN